jgi:hypothetical protein
LGARLAAPLENGHGPDVSMAGHLGAALLLIAALLIAVRGSPLARFLALWTFIALTPLALWRPDMMLGRFTYQAAVPFSLLLALGIGWCLARSWSALSAGALAAGEFQRHEVHKRLRPANTLDDPVARGRPVRAFAFLGCGVVLGSAAFLTISQNRERTREALDYGTLWERLPAAGAVLAGTEIVVSGGPFAGPYHALYLQAVADTRYGGDIAVLRWQPAGEPVPAWARIVYWPGGS